MLTEQRSLLVEANGQQFAPVPLLDEARLRQRLQNPFALTDQFGVASIDVIPMLLGESDERPSV
ncbi:MAG: hypothetical protein M3Q03_09165 [Chloroflexota bacterium]|nr:hypothetical protein [Chloroflexota bacterium]